MLKLLDGWKALYKESSYGENSSSLQGDNQKLFAFINSEIFFFVNFLAAKYNRLIFSWKLL